MGVPKRKRSKVRGRRRRAENMRLDAPNLVACPQCQALIRPHHMCDVCGYYKDRVVKEVKEA